MELNLSDEDVFPQTFYSGISNKPRSFVLCENELHKRSLIKGVHSGTLATLTISHDNWFLKLVETLLEIHPCFFSHRIKQHVLLLSAVTIPLDHLPKMSEVSNHMQKNALIIVTWSEPFKIRFHVQKCRQKIFNRGLCACAGDFAFVRRGLTF